MPITNRQPDNAGDLRRQAFTKPTNTKKKEKNQQVKPSLRLPANPVYSLIDLFDSYPLMAAGSRRDQPECRPDKRIKNALNL